MGLRSDSYPDPVRIVTGTRYMEEEEGNTPEPTFVHGNETIDRLAADPFIADEVSAEDTKLLFSTVRNMADLYWMGQATSTITDSRVERSWGGGMCPEQHWGYLKDGRCFYLRMRHGWASLQLGPAGLDPNKDLPLTNPDWTNEGFDAALAAGEPYPVPFFQEPRPGVSVYPDDPDGDWAGFFYTTEDRERIFSILLDEILAIETGS